VTRGALLTLALALAPAASPRAEAPAARNPLERRVVGVGITFQSWDQDRPWVKTEPQTRRASAVLVGPNRILTTAQMIDEATFLRLETHGRTRPVQLRVVRVDRTINLALLEAEDTAPLSELEPAAVAERMPTSGTLRTVRWRGQQLESAASRVIRFEVERSWGSGTLHAMCRMRTDMAGGGWAEPVFDDQTLVGVTVSQDGDESRAIPAEILGRFLRAEPADDDGFTALGVNWQVNRDAAVSRFLGQAGEPRGILIRQVPWGSTACGVLEPRDILLELGGQALDAEGFYQHPRLGQLGFHHVLAERFRPGDAVAARVMRAGQTLDLTLVARAHPAALDLIPSYADGAPPYVIAGGLVIRELDGPYLRTWGKEWTLDAPDRLLSRYYFEAQGQAPQRRRIVLISAVLPAPYNVGYQDLRDVVIRRVNGREIGQIEDVITALEHPGGAFQVIEPAPEARVRSIVLDAATLEAATAEILEHYQVPAARRERERPLPAGGGDCPGDY